MKPEESLLVTSCQIKISPVVFLYIGRDLTKRVCPRCSDSAISGSCAKSRWKPVREFLGETEERAFDLLLSIGA